MKTKHTSGEWHKRNGDIESHFEIIGDYGTNKTIALLPLRAFVTKEEAEANCRLITAAPDLLDACDAVLTAWHSKPSNMYRKEPAYLQQIRDAIKKATV